MIQRVRHASVTVEGEVIGRIGQGLLVLLGVEETDTETDSRQLAEKIVNLRCFEDEASKFNRTLVDVGGAVLAISQFTLLGDCQKGRRPSFSAAARPETAAPLYEHYMSHTRALGVHVEGGRFGAHMDVELLNDGPVTLLIDTRRVF